MRGTAISDDAKKEQRMNEPPWSIERAGQGLVGI